MKDNKDGIYSVLTDEEIIASVTCMQEADSKDEEEVLGAAQNPTSHADAIAQLDNIMAYLERQADTTPTELLVVKRVCGRAVQKP